MNDNGRIKLNGVTFYILENKNNKNVKEGCSYKCGISVNRNTKEIIYYMTSYYGT